MKYIIEFDDYSDLIVLHVWAQTALKETSTQGLRKARLRMLHAIEQAMSKYQ